MRFRICLFVVLSFSFAACNRDATPPLQIGFKPTGSLAAEESAPLCSVPTGRTQSYDPATGVYHVHFKTQDYRHSEFEITEVAENLSAPVKFRLTGNTKGAGCLGRDLTLSVDGKDYAIEKSELAIGTHDPALFRVSRTADAVDVEFTPKAVALLKPGAKIWLSVDNGW